ncbi:MAG: hypothetical protein MJ074_05365 [Oscillospiraceae bacterium]|nr:hypothetical protein [Oscillospiraceae bacterium]
MKKYLSLALALLLCLSLCACGGSKTEVKPAPAEETVSTEEAVVEEAPAADPVPVNVFVTVCDAGVLRVANEPLTVMDADGDGALNVDAAIAAAHDAFFEGGAKEGFAFEQSEYGMSITKLWGVENGGSYGYYVNDGYVLPDYKLTEGDCLCVYSYADLTGWSDCYAFFDQRSAEINAGEELELTLSMLVYDEEWVLQTEKAEGAKLIVNGELTDLVTDAEGHVTLKLETAGDYTVTAIGPEGTTLVPPVCLVNVK